MIYWYSNFTWNIIYKNWEYAEVLCKNQLKVHTKNSLKWCYISLYEQQTPWWEYKAIFKDKQIISDKNTVYINIPKELYKLNKLENNKCKPTLQQIWTIFADSLSDKNDYINIKVKIDCDWRLTK